MILAWPAGVLLPISMGALGGRMASRGHPEVKFPELFSASPATTAKN